MEEVQKLKYKLESLGIRYTPATEVSIEDVRKRIDYELPTSVYTLLKEIGSFTTDADIHGLGLDVNQLSADVYLRYMVLTSNSRYPKTHLPVMRLGQHTYVTIDLQTEGMYTVDVSDPSEIIMETLATNLWDTISSKI